MNGYADTLRAFDSATCGKSNNTSITRHTDKVASSSALGRAATLDPDDPRTPVDSAMRSPHKSTNAETEGTSDPHSQPLLSSLQLGAIVDDVYDSTDLSVGEGRGTVDVADSAASGERYNNTEEEKIDRGYPSRSQLAALDDCVVSSTASALASPAPSASPSSEDLEEPRPLTALGIRTLAYLVGADPGLESDEMDDDVEEEERSGVGAGTGTGVRVGTGDSGLSRDDDRQSSQGAMSVEDEEVDADEVKDQEGDTWVDKVPVEDMTVSLRGLVGSMSPFRSTLCTRQYSTLVLRSGVRSLIVQVSVLLIQLLPNR